MESYPGFDKITVESINRLLKNALERQIARFYVKTEYDVYKPSNNVDADFFIISKPKKHAIYIEVTRGKNKKAKKATEQLQRLSNRVYPPGDFRIDAIVFAPRGLRDAPQLDTIRIQGREKKVQQIKTINTLPIR